MLTPNLSLRVVLFISLLLSFGKVEAQCNPPQQLPTPDCQSAPLTCLNNACYTTLNNPLVCCTGWCGNNTIINNPQYFQLIPTGTTVEIHIHVDNCSNGSGLQAGIVTVCPWSNAGDLVACNPGTGPGGTMILMASGMVPGQVYWLLIDGSNGATCQYTIDFVQGIFEPQIDDELQFIDAIPYVVCQGFDDFMLVAGPDIPNAHGYYWIFEWAPTDTMTSTLPEITFDIPNNAPIGTWEICALAFSGCDVSDVPICLEIEIVEEPDVDKEPMTFCPEDFPFLWHNINISGPGTFRKTFDSPEGCPFDSIWNVAAHPIVPLGILEVLHCLNENLDPFVYETVTYNNAGSYNLSYPNMGLNGCDSMARLDLTLAGIDAEIVLSCENGEFVLTGVVSEQIPANANIEWEWLDGGGAPIGVNINQLYVLDGGCYQLEATIETNAGDCTFLLDMFCFNAADFQPPEPNMGFNTITVCAQEGVLFTVIEDPNGETGLEYVWTGPFNVPVYQDGSNVVEMDFSVSQGGEVCVFAIGECGQGPSTCFNVEIIPLPIADFSYDVAVCSDSTSIVTFTGSASPTAQLIWDFGNPTSVTGSGVGPYTVIWGTLGNKVINLTVIQAGCDTSYASGIVTVSEIIPPVINCNSTLNSVTFNWGDVAGSSGYLVSINGGAAVPVAVSTYTVGSLMPGTVVMMTLTVVSAGPCPDIILTKDCSAVDCPPQVIILSGQDSACLNNPTIIDLDATENGSPGTGTWSGPGIVDPVMGLFDPNVAMSGVHQVSYVTVIGGCPFTEQYTVTVFDSITADFTVDPVICITDMSTVTYSGNASNAANYNYTFAPATVVSGTGEGPYELRWATPGMKTVRLQVGENLCLSDVITRNVSVVATLGPPVINCAPNTSGILFTWSVDPAAAGHTPNILSGHVGTQVGNSLDFNGLNPGDMVTLEIVTQSAGPCPDRRDTLTCTARQCPLDTINITPVSDICLYPGTGNVNLVVNVINGAGTGSWSGPGIVNPATGVFNPNMAGEGAHQLTYHYIDDGCDFFKSTTVNVYDPPGAIISNTDLIITCASGSIFLNGTLSTGSPLNYLWTTSTGAILSGATTATAEAGAPGTYQLLVTNSISGCKDSVSVVVTQDANIPTPVGGPDKTLTCDSLQFVLGGNSTTGPNIIYTWTTVAGNIVGLNNGKLVTVNRTGQYTLTVRDTVTACQSSDVVMVGIDTSVATIMLTAGDTIDCNTAISTASSSLSGMATNYTFAWSTSDGTIEGSTTTQNINVSQGGTYTLEISNKLNGCKSTEDVFIPESDEIINAVDVGTMNIICHGQSNGALIINGVTGGTAPYTYQWSVSPQGGTMLSSLSPGQYSLTVSDQNGCSFTKVYTITQPEKVTIDVGPNMTVAGGDSVSIKITTNLTNNAIGNIDWGGYDGLFCPGCPVFQFIATTSATVVAMITDTAGCSAEDSMRLTVIVPRIIFVPTIFSPNGDGINDYFTISGRRNLVNIGYLRIYDRWGNQLFEKKDLTPGNEQEGWDGHFKNQPVQSGVYVYVAKLDYEDISETIRGEITVVR